MLYIASCHRHGIATSTEYGTSPNKSVVEPLLVSLCLRSLLRMDVWYTMLARVLVDEI